MTAYLNDGYIDIAGVVGHENFKKYETVFQYSDQLILISKTENTKNLPLLILGKDCFFGQLLQKLITNSETILRIASIESIMSCILAGIGISILPKSIVDEFSLSNNFYQKPLSESCKYSLIRKKGRPLSSSENKFIELLH